MKKLVAMTIILAATVALQAAPARAQDSGCRIICAPVFVAQPGLVVQNAINAPELDAQGTTPGSETDFLLRFTTVVPTEVQRLAFVALVQWFPSNKKALAANGQEYNYNAPAFVYGPVVNLFTAGPISASVDALGVYAKSGKTGDYKHVFAMEGIAGLNLGSMMKTMGPYLGGVSLNVLYSQQISDRVPDFNGHKKLTPNLLFLVTLPIAPLPH